MKDAAANLYGNPTTGVIPKVRKSRMRQRSGVLLLIDERENKLLQWLASLEMALTRHVDAATLARLNYTSRLWRSGLL